MSKKQIKEYAFNPGSAGVGTLKLVGKYASEDFLLVTNITAGGEVLLNFSDSTKPYAVSFVAVSESSPDSDFPYAHHKADGVTVVTFLYNTSQYSSTDDIQVFVESQITRTRPYDFGTDAIERMRVAKAQSMLDADFEYGIQPTKWQSLDLFRGYPSLYEVPGSDVAVSSIVTDASTGTAGIGPSKITVVTALEHGFDVGQPISLRGVDDSVIGYGKAEGSFVISGVPATDTFEFFAKGKVGTTLNTSLFTNFTVLKKSGFYTGAAIGSNPTFNVALQGGSGTFSTSSITPTGQPLLGLASGASSLPPIGSTFTGSGIPSGSQVTAIVETTLQRSLKNDVAIGDTQIELSDVTGITIGHALDDGTGTNVFVTDITGDVVTLSDSFGAVKSGNNLNTNPQQATGFSNFNLGQSLKVDVDRQDGFYTATISPNVVIDVEENLFVYSGSGTGAKFSVSRNVNTQVYTVTNVSPGSFYLGGETITILGTDLGGASPANDLLITINTVGTGGEILTFTASGTGSTTNSNIGTGYSANESLTIFGSDLGGESPANDMTVNILTVGGNGEVLTFNVLGDAISSSAVYSNVQPFTTSGTGTNSTFQVDRTGSGTAVSQLEELIITGFIEAGDLFRVTIDGINADYTALAGDTIAAVRNGVISAVNQVYNNGNIDAYAYIGDSAGRIYIEGQTAGQAFTISIDTTESGGGSADTQAFTLVNVRAAASSSTTPSYAVTLTNPGDGYAQNDTITLEGAQLGGVSPTNDITITINTVGANGEILTFGFTGTASTGNEFFAGQQPQQLANGAAVIASIDSGTNSYNATISSAGSGYKVGYTFIVSGQNLGGASPANDMNVQVQDVNADGEILVVGVSGSPNSGDVIDFRPTVSISNNLNSAVASGTSYTFTSLAEIEVTFTDNHGLLPGSNILASIASSGSNHDLAAGPYLVTSVPSSTKIRYTARAAGSVATGLTGEIYARTDCFYTHRPFDGGVQLGTGSPAHGAQAIRQSKKYIRYQSGKGIMYTTGALFAPSYDLRNVVASGSSIGSTITITTDDVDHSLQVGAEVQITGITTAGYNNHYVVTSIIDENTFTVNAVETLADVAPEFGNQPQVALYKWKGATVRSGSFDDQNGIFFQYDGTNFSVGLRSSTFQLTGTISVNSDSNAVTGTNTRFRDQLKVGDRIVIRGMSHVVTHVDSQTSLSINPDYRGVNNAVNTKAALTRDIIIPQSEWNIDKCDGTGESGYNIEINKMQMIGFQYSWYGAGFIDWMLRGPNGDYTYLHRMRNNNSNTEAYMRSGNLPVRYEVINEGPYSRLSSDMTLGDLTLSLDDASKFPNSGTLFIDNEIVSYSGKSQNTLTGLSRSATFTNFADGSLRSYTAGAAATHSARTGATLLSVTASPQINHWGSAFLTDGEFDEDRGYIFSYRLPTVALNQIRTTLFMIRLSPSVSNAILGDLGERELINRAQLLLKNIDVVVEDGTNSESVIIEGILNPSNYPDNPDSVGWQGLNNQGAGGQPSFAQIATDVDWGTISTAVVATNSRSRGNSSDHYFLKSDISGVNIGDSVTTVGADNRDFNGSQTVTFIQDAWWIDNQTAFVSFSDKIDVGNANQTTFTFTSLAGATAVPGEQVFAFTGGAGGERDGIDLSGLKELTNTPIGGRGAFPNGPDVLAINAYLTGGSGNVTVNLRWSEAQA